MSMAIKAAGDSPTVAADFYVFYGSLEIVAQAAPGAGIVSSVILISDDGDELDIEWVGSEVDSGTHVLSVFCLLFVDLKTD